MVHNVPTLSLSLRIWVCHPNTRIDVRLLGPCFKTGRLKPFRQHPKHKGSQLAELIRISYNQHAVYIKDSQGHQVPQIALRSSVQVKVAAKAIIPEGYLPRRFSFNSNWCWLYIPESPPPIGDGIWHINTGSKRFPFDNFTYCLTLFSKFFSSFPHGTCSLSVSRRYLALDGIYHPFWTAFPNNPTLWKCITWINN